MPARLRRGDGLFRVDMIGPADIDDVHASILEDFVEAVVKRAAQVELVGEPLSAIGMATADRHDFRVRILAPARRMGVGHVADTVNRHAEFSGRAVHERTPGRLW